MFLTLILSSLTFTISFKIYKAKKDLDRTMEDFFKEDK